MTPRIHRRRLQGRPRPGCRLPGAGPAAQQGRRLVRPCTTITCSAPPTWPPSSPKSTDAPASEFTWKELQTLDAGSWFNAAYPDRARPGFVGLKILSLVDIIKIAEGNRNANPACTSRPRSPSNSRVSADLKNKLLDKGWLSSAGSKLGKSNTGRPGQAAWSCKPSIKRASKRCKRNAEHAEDFAVCGWVKAVSKPKSKVTFAESGRPTDRLLRQARAQRRRRVRKVAGRSQAPRRHRHRPIGQAVTDHGDQSYPNLVKPEMNKLTHDKACWCTSTPSMSRWTSTR